MPAKIDQLSEYGITTKGHIIYKSQYKKVVNQATLLLNNLLIAKKSRKTDTSIINIFKTLSPSIKPLGVLILKIA